MITEALNKDWTFEHLEDLMKRTHEEALNSPCLKKKVGALLIDINSMWIKGRGYGGAEIPCKECMRKKYEWQQDGCWSIHSELRALFDYFKNFEYVECAFHILNNHVMLTTHGPCDQCIKYCHYFQIRAMIYDIPYHNDYSKWTGKINIYRLDTENKTIIWENAPKIKR